MAILGGIPMKISERKMKKASGNVAHVPRVWDFIANSMEHACGGGETYVSNTHKVVDLFTIIIYII